MESNTDTDTCMNFSTDTDFDTISGMEFNIDTNTDTDTRRMPQDFYPFLTNSNT